MAMDDLISAEMIGPFFTLARSVGTDKLILGRAVGKDHFFYSNAKDSSR